MCCFFGVGVSGLDDELALDGELALDTEMLTCLGCDGVLLLHPSLPLYTFSNLGGIKRMVSAGFC